MWTNNIARKATQHPIASFVEMIPEIIAIKKIAVSTLHIVFVACLLIKITTFQLHS